MSQLAATEPVIAWNDAQAEDDSVLHDTTRRCVTVLSTLLTEHEKAATTDYERSYWTARRRLLTEQVGGLDYDDRASLLAQQQAWARETQVLTMGR